MTYPIREVTPELRPADLEILVPAYLSIWNHPGNLPFLSFTGLAFTEEQVRGWFGCHLARGIRYYAATDGEGGSVVGILILDRDPLRGASIGGIGVLPDHKARGIGRRLVELARRESEAGGYPSLDAAVFADNFPMLRLLTGLEFLVTGIDHHRGPRGADLLHLRKYL